MRRASSRIKIPVDKIRDVIGPGGKMIRSIIEQTGVKIDVEDDGRVNMASADEAAAAKAIGMIQELTATAEIGKTYLGKVQRIADFGAFVEIMPGTDGLLHISEIANYRVKDVRDELKEGEQILVKVINIDPDRQDPAVAQGAADARRRQRAAAQGIGEAGEEAGAAAGRQSRGRSTRRRSARRRSRGGRRSAAADRGREGIATVNSRTSTVDRRRLWSAQCLSCRAVSCCCSCSSSRRFRCTRPGSDTEPSRHHHRRARTRLRTQPHRRHEGRPRPHHAQKRQAAASFAIDAYRISKRVAAGSSITFEFHANQPGTFSFYCNLTSVAACADMKGTLVVSPK